MRQPGVIIPAGGTIALDLTADDTGVAVELVGNLNLFAPLIEPPHDQDAFVIAEPVTTPACASVVTRFGQPEITCTVSQLHAASFAPPRPADVAGHADEPFGFYHRRASTHQIKELPTHRPRSRETSRHCNLHIRDIALTV
jgi:hypothetical protein